MAIVTNNTNDQYNGISEFPPHPYVLVAVQIVRDNVQELGSDESALYDRVVQTR